MRKLVIAVVAIELLALPAGGTALANDRELMDGLAWTRAFKAEQPVAGSMLISVPLVPATISRPPASTGPE